MMKKCLVIPSSDFHYGNREFWFDHLNSGFKDFDAEHVNVYSDENGENRLMKCHISQIIEIK